MRALTVVLFGGKVGILKQRANGKMSFRYDPAWLEQKPAIPLSQSLPLREDTFNDRESIPFFGGLLPEQQNREFLARNLGVSENNDFSLLWEIGRECAGAVSLIPEGESTEKNASAYTQLSEDDLIAALTRLPRYPLLAGESEVRLSLAGAQNKMALKIDESGYWLPQNNSPSTHILKPQEERFPGLVQNESYCLSLAAALGLKVCRSQIVTLGPYHCLLIERYDRANLSHRIERLHQEDFCQALGVSSRTKYQSEGGPSLKQCFDLVRRVSSIPAIDILLLHQAVLFNFLIGNNDAHGKNFSLLYDKSESRINVRLAPLYDLISTAIYPELSSKMVMKIGDTFLPQECKLKDWKKYWEAIGVSRILARKQINEMIRKLEQVCTPPKNSVEEKIQKVMKTRISYLDKH